MLAENSKGNYSFIRGIGPFSAAVSAQEGFAIVHARFLPLIALNDGYERLERHLREVQRPLAALCGMELRIPKVLSREGFEEFNRPYIQRLKGWGLEVAGANPITRTNVAFETNPVIEPMLAGFYYTTPSQMLGETFVLSGAAEIASREGGVQIVARDDTSVEGLRQKLECILHVLGDHLSEMKLRWEITTTVNVYTVCDIHPLLPTALLPAIG
ncbi:MAG: hypothetical protein JO166_24210, partial [Deltaproteobacteria bacterium]|nr:hypothetical protein [Deltaproteobacteria bacterium]